MKLIIAQLLSNRFSVVIQRVSRVFTAVLCVLVLTTGSIQAGPVKISEVVQTLTNFQNPLDLRLRTVSQDPSTPVSKANVTSGPQNSTANTEGGAKSDSLLSGITATSGTQSIGLEAVEEGVVEGTVCDCGEIIVAGGAFPKWPLLFLAAVPLAFIPNNDCDNCDSATSTPTPTPTPTPPNTTPKTPEVPEPASLFLFGTGLLALGAGFRRRYSRAKLLALTEATKKELDQC
jgi:PEP-CTERM motif